MDEPNLNVLIKDFLVWHGIQQRNIDHVTILMLDWNRTIVEILIMIPAVHGASSMAPERNVPSMDIVKLIAAPSLNYIFIMITHYMTHYMTHKL